MAVFLKKSFLLKTQINEIMSWIYLKILQYLEGVKNGGHRQNKSEYLLMTFWGWVIRYTEGIVMLVSIFEEV